MWCETLYGRSGMPFGMFIFPLFFLVCIGVLFYYFNNPSRKQGETLNNEEILSELRKLRKEVEELKKENEQ